MSDEYPEPTHSWGDRGYDWDELRPLIEGSDTDTFTFVLNRAREDGRSFSAEAVDNLARGTITFFLSRCINFWKRDDGTYGDPPKQAKVIVTVILE